MVGFIGKFLSPDLRRGVQGDFLKNMGFVLIVYSGRTYPSANVEPNLSKIGQVELV